MLTLKLWVPWRHSISSLMTPEESQLSPRLRAMSLEESWLSLRLMALSLGESRHSLGVTKDELECLQGIWDRNCIPRSPQNNSSPPYRKLENGRKLKVSNIVRHIIESEVDNEIPNISTYSWLLQMVLFTKVKLQPLFWHCLFKNVWFQNMIHRL